MVTRVEIDLIPHIDLLCDHYVCKYSKCGEKCYFYDLSEWLSDLSACLVILMRNIR